MIDSFRGQYSFLSNFCNTSIQVDGVVYPTLEHAFQALKTTDAKWKERILNAESPGKAKRLGKQCPLRSGWDSKKMMVMELLLRTKFRPFSALAIDLKRTEPHELLEGNSWGDDFWGVVRKSDKWVGENHLGKLLMKIRDDLPPLS